MQNSGINTCQGDNMATWTYPVTFNSYMTTIWDMLVQEYTPEGAAGLMGSFYAESGCYPWNCQSPDGVHMIPRIKCLNYIEKVDNQQITRYQFSHGGCTLDGNYTSTNLGFGLAQWTWSTRKQGLYDYIFTTTHGTTLNDVYRQTEYAILEISTSYPSVYSVLTTSHNINDCADTCLEDYESPADQGTTAHEMRREYAQQIYEHFMYGTLRIYTMTQGNGTITVSNYSPSFGETVTLSCIPRAGETLTDIIGTTLSGLSVALLVQQVQTFTMPNESINILAVFTGSTPPVPITYRATKHKMRIWQYPMFRQK